MALNTSRTLFDVEPLNRALAVIACMGVFYYECKVYDLASATFIAFGLGLMARRAWAWYFVVFALGSLNRETMALLSLVFAVHFWTRMSLRIWATIFLGQLIIFGVLRVWLTLMFASIPGVPYWLRLESNMLHFVQYPWYGVFHWLGFGFVMSLSLRRWTSRPGFLRSAFIVLIPALTVLYLVFGWVGEIRVFVEAFPVLWPMMSLRADAVYEQLDTAAKADLCIDP
jgi:hypothetical protein